MVFYMRTYFGRGQAVQAVVVAGIFAVICGGCATAPAGRGTATGAGLGAALGAATGAVAGNNIQGISKTEGAVAGAVVGGLLGGAMGNQRDALSQQRNSVDQRLNSMDQQMNTTVISVPNSNGSSTPVVLHHSGSQWVGPRGEVYGNLPTMDQLKPVYGF